MHALSADGWGLGRQKIYKVRTKTGDNLGWCYWVVQWSGKIWTRPSPLITNV